MGPGRTVVIKGEVNANAKGSVLLPSGASGLGCVGRASCFAFLKGGTQCKVPLRSYQQSGLSSFGQAGDIFAFESLLAQDSLSVPDLGSQFIP